MMTTRDPPPTPPLSPHEEAAVIALHQGLRELLALCEQTFYHPLTRAHLGASQGHHDPRQTCLDLEDEPPF